MAPDPLGGQAGRIDPPVDREQERRSEFRAFLFLAVVLAPLLSILIVGGYGFAIWLYQIFAGPPGPPSFLS